MFQVEQLRLEGCGEVEKDFLGDWVLIFERICLLRRWSRWRNW